MTDVFSKDKRSEIMSRVKGKNTKPEKLVRCLLHGMGYRFRLHVDDLPGKPDIVLTRHRKVIFVNGCFWHGHRSCRKGELPASNRDFWEEKIEKNRKRDVESRRHLRSLGWKVFTIWECETKDPRKTMNRLMRFMRT